MIGCIAGLWLSSPGVAHARVSAESHYTKAQNYSAALRFLRVDKGFEVIERDADAAYLIFLYPTPGRKETSTGTIEVVEMKDGVALIVKLPQMPEYHERLLSDQLLKKLRDDYGPPPTRKHEPRDEKQPKEDRVKKGSNSAPHTSE